MAVAEKYEHVEPVMAFEFKPGDADQEAVLRGWAKLPIDVAIEGIPEGSYVVKREDQAPMILEKEVFTKNFRKVITAVDGKVVD